MLWLSIREIRSKWAIERGLLVMMPACPYSTDLARDRAAGRFGAPVALSAAAAKTPQGCIQSASC